MWALWQFSSHAACELIDVCALAVGIHALEFAFTAVTTESDSIAVPVARGRVGCQRLARHGARIIHHARCSGGAAGAWFLSLTWRAFAGADCICTLAAAGDGQCSSDERRDHELFHGVIPPVIA